MYPEVKREKPIRRRKKINRMSVMIVKQFFEMLAARGGAKGNMFYIKMKELCDVLAYRAADGSGIGLSLDEFEDSGNRYNYYKLAAEIGKLRVAKVLVPTGLRGGYRLHEGLYKALWASSDEGVVSDEALKQLSDALGKRGL